MRVRCLELRLWKDSVIGNNMVFSCEQTGRAGCGQNYWGRASQKTETRYIPQILYIKGCKPLGKYGGKR